MRACPLTHFSPFPFITCCWSEFGWILARVVNRRKRSTLYWMWLCLGYSQLHNTSIKHESLTTAILLAEKKTNHLGTALPLFYPAHTNRWTCFALGEKEKASLFVCLLISIFNIIFRFHNCYHFLKFDIKQNKVWLPKRCLATSFIESPVAFIVKQSLFMVGAVEVGPLKSYLTMGKSTAALRHCTYLM